MHYFKDFSTAMTPRRRKKYQNISIIVFILSIVTFMVYKIIFSSDLFRSTLHDVEEYVIPSIYFTKGTSQAILSQKFTIPESEPFHGEKLIHLDLKGAPPLVSYWKEFFPFIRRLGATGILIEYEDMFYYKEDLEDIRALNAYQPSDIKKILDLAEKNNLLVIPLVQTFSHSEFVLKLEKFKDLREIKRYPEMFCPSHERTLPVIKKMIDQILEAHPKAKYIHIGCDEVKYLGKCNKCKTVMQNNIWLTSELFLNHVKNVALYINNTYPGVRPIIWGDMIGKFNEKQIKESQISNLVDLMVWKYVPDISNYITNDLLSMYARIFKNIWIASAFKGATGVNSIITDVKYHLQNHIAWMQIVSYWKDSINFKGITLTGWQRYDHFAELCELLPVAIPSLAVNLHYLSGSGKGANQDILIKILQCNRLFALYPQKFDFSSEFRKCNFPGYLVYDFVIQFYYLSSMIKSHFSVVYEGWFSVHSILHKFGSPSYVKSIFEGWPVDKQLAQLKKLEENIKIAFSTVYDKFTVEEWITNNVTPIRLRLEAFCIVKKEMLERDVWPRRPFSNSSTNDLERAAEKICTSDITFGCPLLLL